MSSSRKLISFPLLALCFCERLLVMRLIFVSSSCKCLTHPWVRREEVWLQPMEGLSHVPEPPRGEVTLGWAAVARPPAAGHRLSVRGLHWCLVCERLQLLYRRPGLQAAICCVRKCGRTWAKDSSSSLFPGNSHFLPKSRSWSSGVVSQTNVYMQRSLRNCLGHLKHETCPNPK